MEKYLPSIAKAMYLREIIVEVEPAIYQRKGIKLALNPISLIEFRLIRNISHDQIVSELIDSIVPNRDHYFIDIGANIGYFSLYANKIRGLSVIAFEPSLKEVHRCRLNRSINNADFQIIPLALSNKVHSENLYLGKDSNPGRNSLIKADDHINSETIICLPFDLLFKDSELISRIRLIKIDVEGFELAVLNGMAVSIESMIDISFVVEVLPDQFDSEHQTHIYQFFNEHRFTYRFGPSNNKVAYDEVFYRA